MSAKHTPGPWVARPLESQEWEIDAPNGDPAIGYSSWTGMVSVYGCNDFPNAGEDVAKANARLIAAAPELLDVLSETVSLYGKPGGPWNVPSDPGGWLERARAAIDAARGAK